jgi:hypothetical protein
VSALDAVVRVAHVVLEVEVPLGAPGGVEASKRVIHALWESEYRFSVAGPGRLHVRCSFADYQRDKRAIESIVARAIGG